MQNAGHESPAQADVLIKDGWGETSGGWSVRRQSFDLFLQFELLLLQLSNMKVIACGMVKFALDLSFESTVPIIEFGNMRLQRHNLPTFVVVGG
tara:strand:+ start:1001 stop:1282 length:282 start_codon:yes stop_codon:yes gene_type:complete